MAEKNWGLTMNDRAEARLSNLRERVNQQEWEQRYTLFLAQYVASDPAITGS